MEDFELDIVIGQGPGRAVGEGAVQPFTLIGATTRAGLLTSPLRARFGIVHRLDFYTEADLVDDRHAIGAAFSASRPRRRGDRDRAALARHAAHRQPPAATRARLCRSPGRRPHHARGLSRRAASCSKSTRTDFDESDRRLLRTIIDKFGGGPVGLEQPRRRDRRREGRDRGHLRAVSHSDRLPRSHAARPGRHRARLRVFRTHGSGKGPVVVKTTRPVKIAGLGDVCAAARAD